MNLQHLMLIMLTVVSVSMALSSCDSHYQSSLGSLDDCRLPTATNPHIKPIWAEQLLQPHNPPSPFIIITQS